MIISNLQEFNNILIKGAPIIAIDYGLKKVGVALSNQEHTFAMPLKIINVVNEKLLLKEFTELLKTYSPCGFVIGLPINMNGEASAQTRIVETFAIKLADVINLPIYLQDERLTSKAADSFMKSMGMNRRDRNAGDDSVAASIILQDTLNRIKNQQN